MTTFDNELKFEAALIELLYSKYGWESEVLLNPTEAELLQNWADILLQTTKASTAWENILSPRAKCNKS